MLRFISFLRKAAKLLDELGLVPLLAGASAEETYAARVKQELREVAPRAIIMENFLTPKVGQKIQIKRVRCLNIDYVVGLVGICKT